MKFGNVYYYEQDIALLASNWSCGQLKQYTLKNNDIIYIWNLEYDTKEPIYKTETDSQRTDFGLPRGREGEGWTVSLGLTDANCLHLKWINNKVLMYSTGNYTQHPVINHNGKEYFLKMHICVYLSLCCKSDWHNIVNKL